MSFKLFSQILILVIVSISFIFCGIKWLNPHDFICGQVDLSNVTAGNFLPLKSPILIDRKTGESWYLRIEVSGYSVYPIWDKFMFRGNENESDYTGTTPERALKRYKEYLKGSSKKGDL